MNEDAKRAADRFYEVFLIVCERDGRPADAEQFNRAVTATFAELMRAEVIFAGPSLYAEP